ncbi:MAG: hypothetical protein Q9205_002385 [Flavoplaca limonia]
MCESPNAHCSQLRILKCPRTPEYQDFDECVGLQSLLLQILQEIAVYLPDKDLKSFSLVQRAARDAVIPANAGHWRQRFRDQYDLPPGKSPAATKEDYILRRCFLTHQIHFKYGQSLDEVACLKAIRQLIVEVPRSPISASSLELDGSPSLNVRQLWRFMKRSNLLHDAFRWTCSKKLRTNRLLEILQVFFFGWNVYSTTHDLLDAYPFSLRLTAYALPDSEAFALAASSRNLVDAEGQIDFTVVSHLTNLWKFHLAIYSGGDLHDIVLQLSSFQYPKTSFEKSVPTKHRLGMKWKGALFHPCGGGFNSYVNHGIWTDFHADPFFTGGNRLLTLTFSRVTTHGKWPQAFEKTATSRSPYPSNDEGIIDSPLQSSPSTKLSEKTAGQRSTTTTTKPTSDVKFNVSHVPLHWTSNVEKGETRPEGQISVPKIVKAKERHFFGLGEYNVNLAPLNVAGVVRSLPPQCGIPGWRQFTMVSYETPTSGSKKKGYLDAKDADLHVFLHYEGIMLPGESIIIGRYFMGDEYRDDDDPEQFLQRGTFIYWLVQDDATDDEDEDEDGVEHDGGDAGADND